MKRDEELDKYLEVLREQLAVPDELLVERIQRDVNRAVSYHRREKKRYRDVLVALFVGILIGVSVIKALEEEKEKIVKPAAFTATVEHVFVNSR